MGTLKYHTIKIKNNKNRTMIIIFAVYFFVGLIIDEAELRFFFDRHLPAYGSQ